MRNTLNPLVVAVVLALSTGVLATDVSAATKKAEISIRETPANDGRVVFLFSNEGSTSERITVELKERWIPETVAQEIAKQLRHRLGSHSHEIDYSGNSRSATVTIRRRFRRVPKFDLVKTYQDTRRVSILVEY